MKVILIALSIFTGISLFGISVHANQKEWVLQASRLAFHGKKSEAISLLKSVTEGGLSSGTLSNQVVFNIFVSSFFRDGDADLNQAASDVLLMSPLAVGNILTLFIRKSNSHDPTTVRELNGVLGYFNGRDGHIHRIISNLDFALREGSGSEAYREVFGFLSIEKWDHIYSMTARRFFASQKLIALKNKNGNALPPNGFESIEHACRVLFGMLFHRD